MALGAHYDVVDRVIRGRKAPVPGATLEILDPMNPGAEIDLFADRDGLTPVANPSTADNLGRYGFFLQEGSYLERASLNGEVLYERDLEIIGAGFSLARGSGRRLTHARRDDNIIVTALAYTDITSLAIVVTFDARPVVLRLRTKNGISFGASGNVGNWRIWDQTNGSEVTAAILDLSTTIYRPIPPLEQDVLDGEPGETRQYRAQALRATATSWQLNPFILASQSTVLEATEL